MIDLPVDARALVDAAAGTGKTHVLAGRLARLVERDDLSAGDEVLVLSFSRAAVAELRARVSTLGGDARYIGAMTFDAFATQLLATEDPDGAWTSVGYEGRIRAAADLLRSPATPRSVELVRHLLVDELQDLVGPRASLVMALLDTTAGGFTLFGDPAQAIYGHQLRNGSDGPTNAELYASIAQRFSGKLSRCTLTHDFRGRTEYSDSIASIGWHLRHEHPDHSEIASQLRTLLLQLPTTSIGAARRLLCRNDDGGSAVLCRTNDQALRLSSELFERGISHRYQRRGEEKAAAGWLSTAVCGLTEPTTTRSALMPVLDRIADERGLSGDELFTLLRRLDPARGDSIDLRRIANRVRDASFPEELNEVTEAAVVVSTVHRAKGLEFDRVFLCEPGYEEIEEAGEENRLLYVALSRARREIFHIERPATDGLRRDPASGRWIRRGFGRNRWRVFELEVLGSDVDPVHPAGTWAFEDDVGELQRYLAEDVAPGDPVEFELAPPLSDGENPAVFVVRHGERPVGVTSEVFAPVMQSVLGSGRRSPSRITGLHVEMVDTVAGDATLGHRHGLGVHGMWKRLRVFGLGVLRFDHARDGGE